MNSVNQPYSRAGNTSAGHSKPACWPGLLHDLSPAISTVEDASGFSITIAAAGFDKLDCCVNIIRGLLVVTVGRNKDDRFTRMFSLPEHTDESAVNACYENNVLRIRLPRSLWHRGQDQRF